MINNIDILNRGIRFNFDIKKKVTLIRDNSGTGKTLFCKAVIENTGANDTGSNTYYLTEDTLLDPDIFRYTIKNKTNTIFVIDNFETVFNQDIIELINNDNQNRFIIIGRGQAIRGLDPHSLEVVTLEYNKNYREFNLKNI